MKVFDLLLTTPQYGQATVTTVLAWCRISPSKTLGGLNERQRDELVRLPAPVIFKPEFAAPLFDLASPVTGSAGTPDASDEPADRANRHPAETSRVLLAQEARHLVVGGLPQWMDAPRLKVLDEIRQGLGCLS
jgi:hypothetical protein